MQAKKIMNMERANPFYKIERKRRQEAKLLCSLTPNEVQILMQKVKSWSKVQELLTTKTAAELREFIHGHN